MLVMENPQKPKNENSPGKEPKLLRLPKNARIEKRPLLHPAIPSPLSTQQKVIYISSYTAFVPSVKRIRRLLSNIDKRSTKDVSLLGLENDRAKLAKLQRQVGRNEEITMKATGRAIEKLLNFALFFQGQPDLQVRIRTGSLAVVDDISIKEATRDRAGADTNNMELEELPETQIRKTSILEVGVSLR